MNKTKLIDYKQIPVDLYVIYLLVGYNFHQITARSKYNSTIAFKEL